MKHMMIMICVVILAGLVTLIYLWPRYGQELDVRIKPVGEDVIRPCPPCTVFAMPPGRWVTSEFFCYWCEVSEHLETWPDSVFILKE